MLAFRRISTSIAGRPAPRLNAVAAACVRALPIARYTQGPGPEANRGNIDYNVHYRADESTRNRPAASQSQTQLAEAALKHVPTMGWTVQALGAGAVDLGYPTVLHGLFPGGGADLIDYFLQKSKNEMRAEMEQLDLASMKITQKIRTACIMRLKLTAPYIARWPDALGIMAQPPNAPMSLRNLGELVDEMWYLAGDRSADLNWYSKRTLLAGVYTSTELYMTQDKSPDFQETWKFLDRRLQDVGTLGRTTAEVTNYLQFGIRSAFGVLSSLGHKTPFDRR
ncbi:Ubiquinone biosynthesis protein coq9, mitochondrial [Geranomyces variabilis]|uniref:Ubiquinone biosynthesis protein n=1 Tax=Geranomyces variabilis TaxID=109894 RepID=A0AAD5XPB4_9FUNG|nr:Ubiquinone biosynthesis protein coq9, mitochondrial [Geranomyces variabilis]